MSLSLPGSFNHLSYRAYSRAAGRGGALFIFPSSCMCPTKKSASRSDPKNSQSATATRVRDEGGKKEKKEPERRDTRRTDFISLASLPIRSAEWIISRCKLRETFRIPGDSLAMKERGVCFYARRRRHFSWNAWKYGTAASASIAQLAFPDISSVINTKANVFAGDRNTVAR